MMERITLGRTGLRVSMMGLGGGGDSRLGTKQDEAQGTRLVRLALEQGINFIDTEIYLLNQSARQRVFIETRRRNIGTLIMFAVRRALSQPARLRELLGILAVEGRIAAADAERGLAFLAQPGVAKSLPEAAYRYCRHEPGAHVVLSGMSSVAHLLENVAALQQPDLPSPVRGEVERLFGHLDNVSAH